MRRRYTVRVRYYVVHERHLGFGPSFLYNLVDGVEDAVVKAILRQLCGYWTLGAYLPQDRFMIDVNIFHNLGAANSPHLLG